MERKRVVQYLMVLVLVVAIGFIMLVAYMTKLAFSAIKEEPVQVEQVQEECKDSICECR